MDRLGDALAVKGTYPAVETYESGGRQGRVDNIILTASPGQFPAFRTLGQV